MPVRVTTTSNKKDKTIELLVDYKGDLHGTSIPFHLFDTPESTRDALIDAIRLILNAVALATHNKTVEIAAKIANELAKD